MQRPSRANNIAHARETGSALPVDLQNVTVSCFAPSHSSASCPPREACAALARTCGWGRGRSVWVDEPRTRWSAWCPACAVITQIVAALWETQEHTRDSPWRRQTEMHTSAQPWTLSPGVLFYLQWLAIPEKTSQTGPEILLITNVDSFVVFAGVHVKLFLFCFFQIPTLIRALFPSATPPAVYNKSGFWALSLFWLNPLSAQVDQWLEICTP